MCTVTFKFGSPDLNVKPSACVL